MQVMAGFISIPSPGCCGSLVVTRIVPVSLLGTASLEFEPDGVRWVLLAPSSRVLTGSPADVETMGSADALPGSAEVMHLQRAFAARFPKTAASWERRSRIESR